jgi:hypothetical protein
MRLDGYEHEPGDHCGSTSLGNLAAYYGWGFDEPECFGLASGLGFSYFELPEDPWRMFVGRPMWLERAFFKNLEIPHTDREGDDWAAAWADVTDRLDDGDPVMVFVDLYYLDYYDTDTHFAPHSLLLVGYDEDPPVADNATVTDGSDPAAESEGVVYTSDSEFDEIQTLPLSSLREAWSAEDVLPLQNRWLVAEGDPQADPETAVRTAIGTTARYMLDPEDPGTREPTAFGEQGVPGIRALAADLPSWHELEDPRWTARFAYQNVERRGTGGGAFRGLYAPFLDRREGDAGLSGFAARMNALANDWAVASETLKEASETDDGGAGDERLRSLLVEAGSEIDAIADREQEFFEDVLAALEEAGGE